MDERPATNMSERAPAALAASAALRTSSSVNGLSLSSVPMNGFPSRYRSRSESCRLEEPDWFTGWGTTRHPPLSGYCTR